jgi:hypothetical protein
VAEHPTCSNMLTTMTCAGTIKLTKLSDTDLLAVKYWVCTHTD